MLMPAQEYLVNDIDKVAAYIDQNIGIDYEVTRDDNNRSKGSIVVFEIEYDEHEDLRQYITDGDMWSEENKIMASVKVDIDRNNEHVAVVVDCKPFYFSYAEDFMLDVDGEPMYDDAEDFIMDNMSGLDEGLVDDVVPQIATKLHPFIEKYLP